jgi:hypothetical protein
MPHMPSRRQWTLMMGHESPVIAPVSWRVPQWLVWCVFAVLLASFGGTIRLSFFTAKYLYARIGLVQLRREHEGLVSKIRFLAQLSKEETAKLARVATFEDFMRMKYGMNKIGEGERDAGIGGVPDPEELTASLLNVSVVRRADSIKVEVEALLRRAQIQNTTFDDIVKHVRRQRDHWAQIPSVWPVRGRITSRFGQRMHPFLGYSTRHEGLDIANLEWTPVVAAADGIATFVGHKQYYGNTVDIDHHGNGYLSRYAHLVQPAVVEGQLIRRGDIVGYMGRTGRATGTHLHYEVRRLGRPLDPMDFVVPVDVVVD